MNVPTRNLLLIIALGMCAVTLSAWRAQRPFDLGQASANERTFKLDGVERTALVYPASKPSPGTGSPLVLAFHGHGGTARFAARQWKLHERWPEAVVVYLQGLPTVTPNDPEGRRPGWQIMPGGEGDRDARFTDAVIEQLSRQSKIDPKRIYAVGHSNGARFAMVLWKMRGEKFAAFASVAGQGGLMIRDAIPRSVFAVAGEQDRLVPYDGQVRSLELVRQILKTDSSRAVVKGYEKIEPGVNGTEFVSYLHPGGHEFPQETLPLIIEFFKRNRRP